MLQRPVEAPAGAKQDLRSFKLILEYIKALPVSALLLLLKKHLDNLFCSMNYIWRLEVFLFIKAIANVMQTGQETDFVLVSCSGLGVELTRREQVLQAKRVSTIF